ncbi:MAG: hypothetical protein Q8O30_03330 [Candidatus Omnitrophota bacterium]|nr:hypothetical protein [Candidatus Omnitrophota bacterium]
MSKLQEKQKAIKLRKQGYSYSEILKIIPVAKSTLSLWLRSVSLARRQKQRLTQKKIQAALRGAETRREQRLEKIKNIFLETKNDIGQITRRELWLIGIILYWAEGSKQKEHNVSQGVKFSNSDPRIIKIFLNWLEKIFSIKKEDIRFRICLHETAVDKLEAVKKYWSEQTGFPIGGFQRIDWKKNKINTKRKNTGENYFGLLNVYVARSTNLNRKIDSWVKGIYNSCGVV